MEISEAGSSSDAAPVSRHEYEVFLNFRGEDTRYGFTDFLYDRLVDAGVNVFIDEEELRIGEVISEKLQEAINNTIIYIPIFSQTYASSKWCLRELALMMDNVTKSKDQKYIFPLFFHVEPDHVKLKKPLYDAYLEEHEKKYPDEVEAWKKALTKVDERKGWVVEKKKSQAEIVKLVVKEVLEKLKTKQKLVKEHLIGLDERVKKLTKFLDVNHDDVRLIGIYGMGGIGKTTIAKVIYNDLCSHFGKHCSFLEDVRERSTTEGIVSLQKKLLLDIGVSRHVENVDDSEEGMRRTEQTFSKGKFLVVLDDVHEKEHIMKLLGISKLHSGSRIIVTTRDKNILPDDQSDIKIEPYEMQTLEEDQALKLFRHHALPKDYHRDDILMLSKEIVSLLGGLPLAITVVGSLLKDKKDKKNWVETLVKLKKVPEKEILQKLRISYDDLDKYHQQIFLDIACFFFNKKVTNPIYMWQSCELYPIGGIEVLIKRCLIEKLDNNRFWMHDQLIDLGRHIVREESKDDLVKQSRLWIPEESFEIIGTEERKPKVQALYISRNGPTEVTTNEDISEFHSQRKHRVQVLDNFTYDPTIVITNEDFKRLPKLRYLKLIGGTFAGDFARCHSNLRWFSWYSPPEEDFEANNLYLNKLAVCKLYQINFNNDSEAWNSIKRAHHLKVLSITSCSGITTIPDISNCLALERLTLYNCSSLERIESFIGCLWLLIELKIEECWNFTDLPEEVGALVKLELFSLSNCTQFEELPRSLENLTSLTELNLSGTAIRELPSYTEKLKSLRILHFQVSAEENHDSSIVEENHDSLIAEENHDWQLPRGISTLVNLEELNLSGHSKMKGEIPVGIGELSLLRILDLESTCVCRIPGTINKLHKLETLNLLDCHEIQELPELPPNLTDLYFTSSSLCKVPNLSNLTNLVQLELADGFFYEELGDGSFYGGKSNLIPGCDLRWIENLSRLERLELNLLNVPVPPKLPSLSHLEKLVLTGLDLKPLAQLPSSNWSLTNLSSLKFICCEVEDIPLVGIPRLETLDIWRCVQLRQLSIPSGLMKLQRVDVHRCPELVEIQVVGLSESLEWLDIIGCQSMTRISGLSHLKNLDRLEIRSCSVLTNVEGLNELESLKYLLVYKCSSLKWLIDAFCTKIPNNCFVRIESCGDSIKECVGDPLSRERNLLKSYREEILLNTSNEIEHPFAVIFVLGVENSERYGFLGGIERENENVTPGSVTYEGLIADVKGFGFRLERMWYKAPAEGCVLHKEIKSDEQVNEMVPLASKRRFVHLYVEGEFESGPSNAECSEATANRSQMGDLGIGHDGSDDADILRSSCQRGEGVERSCEATTQVEDQRGLSSVKSAGASRGKRKGKRKRKGDDDHASHAPTTTKN